MQRKMRSEEVAIFFFSKILGYRTGMFVLCACENAILIGRGFLFFRHHEKKF
jgi:hypothetical protein